MSLISTPAQLEAALRRACLSLAPELEGVGVSFRRLQDNPVDARIHFDPKSVDGGSEIAALIEHLNSLDAVEEARGRRGQVSVRMSDLFVRNLAERMITGAKEGPCDLGFLSGKQMVVNFLNPNATKPLHVGHLRNLSIGEAWCCGLEAAGATVIRQCYICDFGRNVCEAMAGLAQHFRGETPESLNMPSDQFVGACYARYCESVQVGADPSHSPIGAESSMIGDAADELVTQWLGGDAGVRSLWRQVRAWALGGQERTLSRVGIKMDRLHYESQSLEGAARFIAKGIADGIFVREAGGAVVYPTGRAGYPVLELVRPDGLPTEHARVIALFLGEQSLCEQVSRWSVVCGDEWDAAGELELEVAQLVHACPLASKSEILTHGMVTLKGTKMKSRDGQALLIDDFLDELEKCERLERLLSEYPSALTSANLIDVITRGFFLSRSTAKSVEFDWESITNPKRNPAWAVAEAWCRCRHFSETLVDERQLREASLPLAKPMGMRERIAAMQFLSLRQILENSGGAYVGAEIMKFTIALSRWYMEQVPSTDLNAIVCGVLRTSLASVGLGGINRHRARPSKQLASHSTA